MKKLLICILLLICTFVIFFICGILNFNGCNKDNETTVPPTETAYEIKYIIDGEILLTQTALNGESLTAPVLDDKNGFVFNGWYTTEAYDKEWNFSTDTVKNNLFLFGYWVKADEQIFNVHFMDGDKLIETVKVKNGSTISKISITEKDGYTFLNWRNGDNEYDFDTTVVSDLTLTANWELNTYTVSFIADGSYIEKVNFTVENMQISEPQVPTKKYYSADWEEYSLTLENFEVNAVYTPVTYTATIIIDNLQNQIKYTVEDQIKLPEIPQKTGYTSSWDSLPPDGGDFTIKAIYTPIVYHVYFKANGNIIKTLEYTVENKNIIPPEVPHIDGYEGNWEQNEFETGDIIINAVYSIIVYTVKFIVDNEVLSIEYFQADKMTVEEPEIPVRTGYTSSWEEYILSYENIQINAIYTPIKYTAYLLVDDSVYDSIQFTIEDNFIALPAVPEKQGYTSVWESYAISANDLLINAIYTPIIYFATFITEGTQIAKIPFTVENNNINIPAPPQKSGYTVKWSDFYLGFENVTVYATYELINVEGGWDETDNFEYESQADGSLILKKYIGNSQNPVIPSFHDDLPIKSIGVQAFSGSGISAIRISDGIEIIKRDAFLNCRSLTTVILPDSLITIEQNAFAYCGFTEIILPEGINEIGTQAFTRSKLQRIKIPDNVKDLEALFWHCDNLESVILGENVETIKSNAFNDCRALINVNLNENLKVISTDSFNNCPLLESIIIPGNVELIEPKAFTNCDNLNKVHFEDAGNWTICNETNVPVHDLDISYITDDNTAALWLTKIHVSRYWKKLD